MAFKTIISGAEDQSIITLSDLTNNTSAEIYAFGALLNKFSTEENGKAINVIDGFSSPAEAKENITVFFKSAKLSPFACRIKKAEYRFGNKNYRLRKHFSHNDAIHGLIYDSIFSITRYASDDNAASVTLEYEYNKSEEGYPFRYKCMVEYTLTAGNALSVKTTVTNTDQKLVPVADGWHPYFTLGGTVNNYLLEFQSREMLEFDADLVPTGKLVPFEEFGSIKSIGTTSFDNCFTLNFAECQPMCVIRNPSQKVQIEFHPSDSYPYLQIFTPDHRKSIAVENLSAAPDAFNNGMGLKVLEPGQSAAFSTTFIIRFL